MAKIVQNKYDITVNTYGDLFNISSPKDGMLVKVLDASGDTRVALGSVVVYQYISELINSNPWIIFGSDTDKALYTTDILEGDNLYYTETRVKSVINDGSNYTHNHNVVTDSINGFMSSQYKIKLDGIDTNANNYVHPSTSGNKHIPGGGYNGQILTWSADGVAIWGDNTSGITYSFASGTVNGTINVTPSNSSTQAVSVYGLGTAAYADTSDFNSKGISNLSILGTDVMVNFDSTNHMLVLDRNINIIVSNVLNNIGATGSIIIKQNSTGNFTFTLSSEFKTPGGLSIAQELTPNSINVINYFIVDSATILVNYMGKFQ